jgi:hypothetical protein
MTPSQQQPKPDAAPRHSLPRMVRPKTHSEWAAYRCALSCKIGRDAIERKGLPDGLTPTEYALYNLLHAVEDLAKAIGPNDKS